MNKYTKIAINLISVHTVTRLTATSMGAGLLPVISGLVVGPLIADAVIDRFDKY